MIADADVASAEPTGANIHSIENYRKLIAKKGTDMSDKVTIVCPTCGSTGTHHQSFKTGDGAQMAQCSSCHKGIRIEYHKGQVVKVVKR